METAGQVNVYLCTRCRRATATVNLADGVTPMFVPCPRCGGVAGSEMYDLRRCANVTCTHAWLRPTGADEATRDHLLRGGLLLVPLRAVLRPDDPVTRAGGPRAPEEVVCRELARDFAKVVLDGPAERGGEEGREARDGGGEDNGRAPGGGR